MKKFYKADDGTIFSSRKECEAYEKKTSGRTAEILEEIETIANRHEELLQELKKEAPEIYEAIYGAFDRIIGFCEALS